MARSDLIINLAQAASTQDKEAVKKAIEGLVADERRLQHHIFADRLARFLSSPPNANKLQQTAASPSSMHQGKEGIIELIPRKNLTDLMLSTPVVTGCRSLIEEQTRADVLRANGIEPRQSLLLIGPPGNGKTSLAEAIAFELGVPFIVVRYEMLIGSFLGETATRLKHLFDYTRTLPCVLFFDEFDTLGKERGDLHETGEIKRVVSSLLLQIDALPSYTIIIAATNHPELLDRAVWRRFQLRLELPFPTRNELIQFCNKFIGHYNQKPGVSSETLAKTFHGSSYAEVEEFWLNVQRRMILAFGDKALKQVIDEERQLWRNQVKTPL